MKTSFRIFSGFVVAALFAWLMPLGAFINSSQEKTACGGARAFHMCSMMSGKAHPEGAVKISYSNANSAEKSAKSSASGGDDFLPVSGAHSYRALKQFEIAVSEIFCPQFFQDIQVPPPKATILF